MDSLLVVNHLIHPLQMDLSLKWRALTSHFLPWVEPKQCFLISDSYQDLNILEALVNIFCYWFLVWVFFFFPVDQCVQKAGDGMGEQGAEKCTKQEAL